MLLPPLAQVVAVVVVLPVARSWEMDLTLPNEFEVRDET